MEFFNNDEDTMCVNMLEKVEENFVFKCYYCEKKFSEKKFLVEHLRSCEKGPSTSRGKCQSTNSKAYKKQLKFFFP